MKKKFLALVLTLAMVLSLVPMTALATNGLPTPDNDTADATQPRTIVTADTADGVHISKRVEEADDGNYNLVMEAYVEGNTEIVDSSRPLDIVLVLDVSGSMAQSQGWFTDAKIVSLKSAVNNFIDEVAKKNIAKDGSPVGHRISIVKFAGNKSTEIGNDAYTEESGMWPFIETNTYNYSQIVKPLTEISTTGKTELQAAVNNLSAAGATRSDYGMELAQTALTGLDESRGKVVVMFTDGTPTSGSQFESNVASKAISVAKSLKDAGAKVYTVGIFNGANPNANVNGSRTSNENKYMQAVSSNYPNANLETGHWNFGTRADNANYYLTASSKDELSKVFEEISQSITTSTVTAGVDSVLRDTLTEQFVLNGNENDITVQKAKVTDKTGNTYSWETPENVDVEKAIDGKTVTVKGFNYTSEDNVITEKNGVYSGYKLIVTIPIKVDETYEGWDAGRKNYDTNTTVDNKAGLTNYKKDEEPASTLLDTSPQVPVTAYTVTYKYDKEYAGAPNLSKDTKAYLPGKILSVQPTPNWDGYSFSGWHYPDTIQVTDGKFSVPESDVEITGSWTENQVTIHYVALEGGTITESTETDQKNYSEIVGLGQTNPQATGATAKPNEGQYFVGWYSNTNCWDESFVSGDMHYAPAITSQQDGATYYAKFSDKQTITIKVPNETLTYTGQKLTGKSYDNATISQEGYRIEVTGSYKPAEGTTVSLSDTTYIGSFEGVTFKVFQGDQDVTSKFNVNAIPGKLYIKGNVAYDANTNDTTVKGLPTDERTYFLNEAVTTKTETPTRDGYDFAGWTLSKEDQATTVKKGQMGATGLTFYAKWSEKKVDVKLSDLIKKELTVKKDSKLPAGTTFSVKVTQTGTQPDIIGTTTNTWENGTTDETTGDTTYTVPFDFGNKDTLSLSAGTYTYTVQETQGNVSGMKYDSNTYTLTIEVKDSKATVKYATDDAEEATPVTETDPLTITNMYQTPYLSVTKQTVSVDGKEFDSNTVAHVGEQIVWAVSVTNKKTTQASTQLKDTLGDVKVYKDGQEVTLTGDTWTATVPANDTVTYYVTYTVQAKDIPNGKIVNTIVKDSDEDHPINSAPVSTWDNKQLKSATKLDTSDWTTMVTLTLPTVNGNKAETTVATDNNNGNPVEVQPIIAISEGSYVIDQIGNEFTFMDELSLKVNGTELSATQDTTNKNLYRFGTETGGVYPYTVTYTAKNGDTPAQFTWNINKDVYAGTKVTLSYKLKLTNPNTAAGTYGVEDLNGNGQIEQGKTPIYTNESAALYKDADTKLAEFPKPSVSYTVNGGGGGGGGSHKPTVTIPDDVPTGLNGKDHYAYVVGYPDGMVYPQKNITRAEVATIFFRLLKDETREANMTKSNGYNDMKDGAWYTCAVSTLSKMGIIKGYEDGSFKPDASISRAEFAAIAARFDPDGDKTPATFSDVSSHWAKDEISIAANHGWIKGYEDGSFKPDQKITRAETMTLVNRVLKRLPETKDDLHKDMKTWPDNQKESAWFYLAVQEATNSHYQKLKKDGTHETWESMRETRDWAALEK